MHMIELERIGRRLKERRDKLGLTHDQVADLIHASRSTYTRYEGGKVDMSISTLETLAEALECTLAFLVGVDDSINDPPEDEEGEVLRYFRKIPPLMRPQAKAVLRAFIEQQPDYEEGRVFGKKAE
jgi:transcriptional regulator with XRE-family HTH domain